MSFILGQETATRRRYAAYTRDSQGKAVDGALTSTTIRLTKQPLNGRDLKLLPEGLRQEDTIKVYTRSALRTANQHDGTPADEVVIDSIAYRVMRVDRQRMILPHYRAYGTRQQEA